MDTDKSTLKFQIDIQDYQDDDEIIKTIKNLLKLTRDTEFIQSVFWEDGEKISAKANSNISILISGCDCI